jgi:hypothetical protein
VARQGIEHDGHVVDGVAFDEPEAIVIEAAESHVDSGLGNWRESDTVTASNLTP